MIRILMIVRFLREAGVGWNVAAWIRSELWPEVPPTPCPAADKLNQIKSNRSQAFLVSASEILMALFRIFLIGLRGAGSDC
jgi:hypothetical protein